MRSRASNAVIEWMRQSAPEDMLRIATRIVDRRLAVTTAVACVRATGLVGAQSSPTCCKRLCADELLAKMDAWLADPSMSWRRETLSDCLVWSHRDVPSHWRYALVNLGLMVDAVNDVAGDLAGYAAKSLVQQLMRSLPTPLEAAALLVPIIRQHVPYPRRGALIGYGSGCYVLDLGCRNELGWERGPWWIALQCEPRFGARGGLRWNGYMEGPAEEIVPCIPDGDLLLKVHQRHLRIDAGEESARVDFWNEFDKRSRRKRHPEIVAA